MPVSTTQKSQEKFCIDVPRQFRDYLMEKQNKRYAFGLSLYTAVVLFFGLVMHWGWHFDAAGTLLIPAELIVWHRQLKKPWRYEIDRKQITVIWFEGGGRFWRWLPVQWKRREIIEVAETEWRGLPALRLLSQVKNPKRRPEWLIVYGHQEAERVRTQILPLIEQCRHQYRTPVLADKLSEG